MLVTKDTPCCHVWVMPLGRSAPSSGTSALFAAAYTRLEDARAGRDILPSPVGDTAQRTSIVCLGLSKHRYSLDSYAGAIHERWECRHSRLGYTIPRRHRRWAAPMPAYENAQFRGVIANVRCRGINGFAGKTSRGGNAPRKRQDHEQRHSVCRFTNHKSRYCSRCSFAELNTLSHVVKSASKPPRVTKTLGRYAAECRYGSRRHTNDAAHDVHR